MDRDRNSAEKLLVSLHIPKTGGSTLAVILEEKFGARLQKAYSTHNNPKVEYPACIHGHDVLELYGDVIKRSPATWITFLRDPLLSAISMYHYVKRRSAESDAPHLIDRGLDAWLTHADAFQWPNPPGYNHNRYSHWLARHKLGADQFDFIGLTDRFDDSMAILYKLLGWPPITYRAHNEGVYRAPELSAEVVARFHELNLADYALYENALKTLERRMQNRKD